MSDRERKSVSLDSEVADLIPDEENYSALVNRLTRAYYQGGERFLGEEERINDVREIVAEIREAEREAYERRDGQLQRLDEALAQLTDDFTEPETADTPTPDGAPSLDEVCDRAAIDRSIGDERFLFVSANEDAIAYAADQRGETVEALKDKLAVFVCGDAGEVSA
ncbi:hypothetical protein [Halomarina rubra]|uniref:Uncharacterized protein n=1 Tax=Halomarina rubra TaxID=2071873 RepID=A0ABD6B187_9EURY|nr:hypothetical protein [Halomarina rubra]